MDANEGDNSCPPPGPQDRGRFPWRIIPVVLLQVYGGLLILLGVVTVFMLLGGCSISVDKNHLASGAQTWGFLLWHVLIGVHGCLAVLAGESIWKRRWRRSFVFLAGAVAVAIAVAITTYVILSLPPGTELPRTSNGVETTAK